MHQHQRARCLRSDADHRGVCATTGDVVEDRGTRSQCPICDGGTHRVDRDGDALGDQPLDDGDDPAQLLVGVDADRARSGRLTTDVDEIGAQLGKLDAMPDRGCRIQPFPSIGERVGSHVDHPHDEAAVDCQPGQHA